MTAQCEDVDFDLSIAEFRINGYAVLEDVFSVSTTDRIWAAFLPILNISGCRKPASLTENGAACEQASAANRMSTATR